MSADSQRLLRHLAESTLEFVFASCTVNWTMELNQLHCGNELWRGICDLRIVGSRPSQDFFFPFFQPKKKNNSQKILLKLVGFFPPFFSQFSFHIVSKVLFLFLFSFAVTRVAIFRHGESPRRHITPHYQQSWVMLCIHFHRLNQPSNDSICYKN